MAKKKSKKESNKKDKKKKEKKSILSKLKVGKKKDQKKKDQKKKDAKKNTGYQAISESHDRPPLPLYIRLAMTAPIRKNPAREIKPLIDS